MALLKQIVNYYDKFCYIIYRITKIFLGIAFFSITIFITFRILTRYVGNYRTGWILEYIGYALVAITFWGASVLTYENNHIKVNFIRKKLPLKVQKWLKVIAMLAAIYLFTLYTIYGYRYAQGGQNLLSATRTFELYQIRMVTLVSGCIIMVLQSVNSLLKLLVLDDKEILKEKQKESEVEIVE